MKYLLLDTETVGLNPPVSGGSGVVQIAWLELDSDGELLSKHSHLVNPQAPIHREATKVHGITEAMVANAPTLDEVFQPLGACTQISHNAVFDLRFVGNCYENLAGSICTLELARYVWPKAPNHKLVTLTDYLGLGQFKAHDALGDVLATYELLKRIKHIMNKDMQGLLSFCSKPKILYNMPFGMYKGTSMTKVPMEYIRYFDNKEVDKNLRAAFDQQIKLRG